MILSTAVNKKMLREYDIMMWLLTVEKNTTTNRKHFFPLRYMAYKIIIKFSKRIKDILKKSYL